MAKVTYPGDATERNATTLESLGMEFMGYDSVTKAALRTTYTNLKAAILGGGGLPSRIEDADQDTQVETEKTADDDTIRFSTVGVERGIVEPGGKLQWSHPLDLTGGVSAAAPPPQLTFGTYLDNSGNPSISHIDLYNAEFGLGITSDELNIITKDMIKMYDVDDLATALITLDSGNSKFSSYHPLHVGADDVQAISIPDQTDFLGTMILGDGGGSLSHVSGVNGQKNLIVGLAGTGNAITSGFHNVLLGATVGGLITSGFSNTCIGFRSGSALTTTGNNVFIGTQAGQDAIGLRNTIIGDSAGQDNTGNYNVFLGRSAGENNIGSANIFLGYQAGYNETGSNKLYIENSTSAAPLIYGEFDNDIVRINGKLQVGFDGTQAIFIPDQTNFLGTMVFGDGGGSLSHTSGAEGFYNTIVGLGAGSALSTGSTNALFGYFAGNELTTGASNLLIGSTTGRKITTGSSNLAIGKGTARLLVSGSENVLLGEEAGYSILGSGNVALGFKAARNETGSNKLYIENSDSASPLIYGEFDNDIVRVNGELQTSVQLTLDEQTGDPTQQANKGLLYTKDVTGVTELFYMRSDGTTVQLT